MTRSATVLVSVCGAVSLASIVGCSSSSSTPITDDELNKKRDSGTQVDSGAGGKDSGVVRDGGTSVPDASSSACDSIFGEVQAAAAQSAEEGLADQGMSGIYSISKTKTNQTTEIQGKTVDLYDVTLKLNASKAFQAEFSKTADTNQWVECKVTDDKVSVVQYSTKTLSSTTATAFCDSMYKQGTKADMQRGAMGVQGLNPQKASLESRTASSVALAWNTVISLKTSGSYSTGGETGGYAFTKDKCKAWLDPSYSPYPDWKVNAPSGTAEMITCIDPDTVGAYDPGLYAVDASSAAMKVPMSIPSLTSLTTGLSQDQKIAGRTITIKVRVPSHSADSVSSDSRDKFVTMSAKCAYDEEAEDWIGGEDACPDILSTFKVQVSQGAYDQMYGSAKLSVNLESGLEAMLAASMLAGGVAGIDTSGSTWESSAVFSSASLESGYLVYKYRVPYCPTTPTTADAGTEAGTTVKDGGTSSCVPEDPCGGVCGSFDNGCGMRVQCACEAGETCKSNVCWPTNDTPTEF